METMKKKMEPEFRAVDFMRKVRSELSEKYLRDKHQYVKDLKRAMEDFKCKQKEAFSQQ